MGGKHAPIELGKYLEIHNKAMRELARSACVLPDGDGLNIERTGGGLLMSGAIRCAGGIRIEVTKVLAILAGDGESALVQTTSYTYHVLLEGIGNLLRYCGPHDDEAHPEHKPFHHKHTYDALNGDVVGTSSAVDPDTRPTLAEVISEACHWYFEHAHEIEVRRGCR